MRKLNSMFTTSFISESGTEAGNRTYYGYVELDDHYCLAVGTALDLEHEENSAKLGVDTVISLFTEHPTMKPWRLRQYIKRAHEELKGRSANYYLKACILVVVSDYTRIRYVQCGNSMLYLIRSGRMAFQSKTCTVFQGKLDEGTIPDDGVTGTEYLGNLTGYLGSPKRPELLVSKPFRLENGDYLLLMTPGIRTKLCPVEILEADETRTESAVFLNNLEALYLSGMDTRVPSYCLTGIQVNKIYYEDEAGKKKRRNRLILLGFLVMLVLLLALLAFHYTQKKRRELQQELNMRIENYLSSGDLYLSAESYDAATKQYEKALEEASKLANDKQKLEAEETLLEKISTITDLQKANAALESGDYQMAVKLYRKVKGGAASYPELDLGRLVSKNLSYANRQIEILNLKDYAKLTEGAGDYATAMDTYSLIYEIQRILEDYDGMKQTKLSIFDLKQASMEAVESEQAAVEAEAARQEQEAGKQAAAEAEVTKRAVDAAQSQIGEAQQAVLDKDYKTALLLYRKMREELLAADAKEEADQVYQTIISLELELERQLEEDETKELDAQIQLVDARKILAEQALLEGNKEEAKRIYREMSDAYIKLNQIEKASEIYRLLLELK